MTEVQTSYASKPKVLDIPSDHFVTSDSDMGADITVDVDGRSSTTIIQSLITLLLADRGLLDVDEKLPKEMQQPDGKSLEKFIVEEIDGPLGTDFHQRVVVEQQQEGRVKLRLRPQTTTTTTTTPSVPHGYTNGHSNGHPADGGVQAHMQDKLYPDTIPPHRLHPNACDFSIVDQGSIGKALVTHRGWSRGDFMARFDGLTVPEVMLHTLQKTDRVHLWDPHFIGVLAHSCNPNVMLDMGEQEMWAIQDIEPGSVLSMDYASTEDHLFRTFHCGCGAPSCRGEVTGRKQRCNSLNGTSQ